MAIWHIRKKSTGRKRPRSGHSISDRETSSPQNAIPLDYREDSSPRTPELPRTPRRGATLKKRRMEGPRPQGSQQQQQQQQQQQHQYAGFANCPQRYSFNEDRSDEMRFSGRRSHNNLTQQRQADHMVWEAPTLSPRRSKKNGKLQKNSLRRDPVREAEIRAMSSMSDQRPTSTYSARSRKGSRRNRNSHTRSGSDYNKETDEFPSPDSLRSSMSSDGSDAAAYRVTALGCLAPRPTLRYASRPNWSPSADRFPKNQRNIDLPPVAANIRSQTRINELADDFDSSDLRTLMERDTRRRERKRVRDQERAAERIARKKAEQLAEAQRAAVRDTPAPRNMDRGVMGRELMDPVEIFPTVRRGAEMEVSCPMTPKSICSYEVQVEQASPVNDSAMEVDIVDSPIGNSASSSEPKLVQAPEAINSSSNSIAPGTTEPSQDQKIVPQLPSSPAPVVDAVPERVDHTRRPHASSVSFTPTISPSMRSAMSAEPSATPSKRLSLRLLLRWGSLRRRKHNRQISSFSNISRDIIAAEAAKARELAAGKTQASTPQMRDSNEYEVQMPTNPTCIVPRRTQSRFREDLPELPISPPASPERENDLSTIRSVSERLSILYSINSSPSKHTHHRSIDALNCVSSSFSCDAGDENEEGEDEEIKQSPVNAPAQVEEANPSPEPMSISMAPIDSEGDWLAGRISPRKIPISQATSRQYPDSVWTADAGLSTSMSTTNEDPFLCSYSSHTQHGEETAEEDTTRTVGESDMEMDMGESMKDARTPTKQVKVLDITPQASFDDNRRSTSPVVVE